MKTTNPIRRSLLIAVALWCSFAASAQMTLVNKGKARTRIICADTTTANRQAAQLLNYFVEQLSGIRLPEGEPSVSRKGDIVIGEHSAETGTGGYAIVCKDGTLRIMTGGGKGACLGVAHLLEKYFKVNYLAKNAWSIRHIANDQWQPQHGATLLLPAINEHFAPAFTYRQTNGYSNADSLYTAWFGLEEPSDLFIANMWVHTANQILPASRYGKAHPEWYSMINGKRQPGDHSQWCLTNEALFRQVCHNLDSIFALHPDKQMISISQNDGNNTNCQCPMCRKLEEEEGSPSGPIIRFLNKLARRYPDKQFSTLAYLFSMQPPKHVRPLPNVNIMLCSIDSRREVPLTDNASGRDFVKALTGWAAITNNIFVWDYGINFDNLVSPFPNFHVLQPNMRLFRDNHVHMLFEQVNGNYGTDFSELRGWMIGKLMQNPDADADSLMRVFLTDYYGDASPYIYSYRKIMEGALLASHTPLWIYDSPISHKNGMLNDELMKTYGQLFDKAEQAVAQRPELLRRVRLARLPLQYSWLEIARTKKNVNIDEVKSRLETFRSRCEAYGVTMLNERNNSPEDYCRLYSQRYLPTSSPSKALGATVTYKLPPSDTYKGIGATALTDGLYGGMGYVEGWVGWEGSDADLTLDLGTAKTFSHISTDFLHQLGAWVLLPKSVTYEVSADGKTWQPFGKTFTFDEDRSASVKFKEATADVATPITARYIHVLVKSIGMCPPWHYGVGHPAWFFMDEIKVE